MERNILVDKLKGYACFLVLFGHVIMGVRLAEINIPPFFEGVEKFIWSFHIALFMFLSGVVYKETNEWRNKKTKFKFITHKLLNLGIPYVVFSVIYIAINSLVGGTNNQSSLRDILNIWKEPVAQYWFLYALFFLFLIWTCLSGMLKNWQITAAVVALGYVLSFFDISFGGFDVVFYSALSFGIGTVIPFSYLTKPSAALKVITVCSHLAVGVLLVVLKQIEEPFFEEAMALFGIYAAVSLISLVQNCKPIEKFLLFMNKYSFQLYLLHTIFTAGIRIILLRLSIAQWWIHVIVGTICGIVFPVLAAIIAKKFKFLDFFFFPTKYLRKKESL